MGVLTLIQKLDMSHLAFSINCKFLLANSDVENILENTFFRSTVKACAKEAGLIFMENYICDIT